MTESETAAIQIRSTKFCAECGAEINSKAEICPKCGVRHAPQMVQIQMPAKNKNTAAVLALFLGGLGAHKFYLGNMTMGIIYLACCWTFIPALISLVEGIQLLAMSDMEFHQKYG
jgi:TM2 domain-containing membrane protein YozV/ribosomal protein L40E